MSFYLENRSVIHKRSIISRNVSLQNHITNFQVANKSDVLRLLEILNTTNDLDLQIKLFSALSAYLMFNKGCNVDVIVKSYVVYDKILKALGAGVPRKALAALYFLSAVLLVDVESGRSGLAECAKNMARTSGCLAILSDMFTNYMMCRDSWLALCQCVAAACNECQANQSYCTHLIPVCVKKCNDTNIEVFLVLNSLLLNHNRNIEVFLKCNGISVFTRELLHYDKCLQLLIALVQDPASYPHLQTSHVLQHLTDFVQLYGPRSQIGQKAVIILNHIRLNSKELISDIFPDINAIEHCKVNNVYKDKRKNIEDQLDDTNKLMQNVIKEINDFERNHNGQLTKGMQSIVSPRPQNKRFNHTFKQRFKARYRPRNSLNRTKRFMNQSRRNKLESYSASDMTFSFLCNKREPSRTNNDTVTANKSIMVTNTRVDTHKELSTSQTIFDDNSRIDLKSFSPIFSSTPKPEDNSQKISMPKISTPKTHTHVQQQKTKIQKRKNVAPNMDIKNKSVKSKFLSAINDSCTTFVKTVASIFKKKESDSTNDHISSEATDENKPCNASFLNYMQKRDAFLNASMEIDDSSVRNIHTISCVTCDNTEILKRKLSNDEHLKQTLNKLKVGINLYGCDFKKMSKTLWPRESYMTPAVLYNLYRKLLLK